MKKIVIALSILLCLVVVSVMAALPATARAPMFAGDVPCAWLPDEGDPINLTIDPTMVNFTRVITGDGYENRYATIATRSGANGINARLTARGSGTFTDSETIYIDTWALYPELEIDSTVNKLYGNISFVDGMIKPKDEPLRGMICTRNYEAGVAVSERYLDTYDRVGTLTHEGDSTRSSTVITDMTTYGTTRLGVTVKDPEDKTHTVLWSRDEHTGLFTRNINITVQRYLAP